MARELATTKETGGGGFAFADRVGAWFLLQMLSQTMPLQPRQGIINEVQFETRESGWLLDDLLLVLADGPDTFRCAISTKSDTKLSKGGFDTEFVRDAWEQWRGVPNATFDRERDYLGLATGGVPDGVLLDWADLERQASSGAADRLEARLAASSLTQRRIFESVVRPGGSAETNASAAIEGARLLARIRVFSFDFEFPQSADERRAVAQCRDRTRLETVESGAQLWNTLIGVAAESRTTGASISVSRLLRAVRDAAELKEFPDYRTDWEKINNRSAANMAEIRTTVGDNIHLERNEEQKELESALERNSAVALVGESGSGKSALVSAVAQKKGGFDCIVWLKPEQISQPSEPDLVEHLGLRHGLGTLIEGSVRSKGLLVVDSFERFESDARARAIELVRMVRERGESQWKIVITAQTQNWLDARRSLLDAGLSNVEVLAFAKPKPDEVAAMLASAPGVARLFDRRELQPILCNLAILHWVINTERTHPFDESRTWVGEAELIGWIWEHWCGTGRDQYRRDALLRLIGDKEGERISGAVSRESIPTTELDVLRDLERGGVIRVTDSLVEFTHDLIGDWARFHVLLAAGDDVTEQIRQKVVVPRWARGIRLYAQGLAERQEGLERWKSGVSAPTLKTVDAALTRDLFLDAIVFAANVGPLLDQLWPDLVADKGKLLGRLLARLTYAATVPDWRMKEEVEPEDIDLATAWFRIPHPLYWVPILRVLDRHAGDVARYAPFDAARALELWLRTMQPGFPGRKEAGALAIELAREMQGLLAEDVIITGEIDRPVYEALLHASPEYPEEVCQVALELAGRREVSHAIIARGIAARQARERPATNQGGEQKGGKRRNSSIFVPPPLSRGAPASPAADGPSRRVPSGFGSAVLDTTALNGLVSVRPEVAREVLLAVCLEEPRSRGESNTSPFTVPGLANWHSGSPPMYWKGAFLGFLRLAPKEGLDAILRLVNYATEQRIRQRVGSEAQVSDYGLEISLRDKKMSWGGDFNTFGWYRNAVGTPDVVACALMALEKWFYDLQDRGESIDPWVERIYEENRSLSLAGVLTTVGLRRQELFKGVLQRLLGTLQIFYFQSALAEQDRERIWSIGTASWGNQGKKAIGLVLAWHQMEHRTLLLQDAAIRLMLEDKETGAFLVERRKEWEGFLPAGGKNREELEVFLARFDPQNYTAVQLEDGTTGFEGKWPAHLEARLDEKSREIAFRRLALTLPRLARECLSGQKRIGQDQLAALLKTVQWISEYPRDDGDPMAEYAASAVLGGIAVLLVDHRDWLRGHLKAERWCIETLRGYASRPAWEKTGENDGYTQAPEGFLGEAAVALLPELNEEWVKRTVLRGATALQYQATLYVLSTAHRLRAKLGPEFPRLLNVIVSWSVLRRAAREALYSGADAHALAKCRKLLADRYLRGRIGTAPMSLARADRLGTRLVATQVRRSRPWELEYAAHRGSNGQSSRRSSGLDLEVLRLGFAFLGLVGEIPPGTERDDMLRQCEEFLEFELSMVPKVLGDRETRSHGPIYEFDQWLFQVLSEVLCADISPSVAEGFWRPILATGMVAQDWIEAFLMEFFRTGLGQGTDRNRFARIWKQMIAYAFTSPAWGAKRDHNWYERENLWSTLMGLRYGAQTLGLAEHRALIEEVAPEYQRWASTWLGHSSSAVSFAYFLASESGRVLLPMGLPELAKAMGSFNDYEWRRERVTDALSAAVRMAWRSRREDLRTNREFWEAFQAILNALCTRLDSVALQIRTETAEFVGTQPR